MWASSRLTRDQLLTAFCTVATRYALSLDPLSMALVNPTERTAADGCTNAARYLARPAGPALVGAGQSRIIGLPFLSAGTIKAVYDLVPWAWSRQASLAEHPPAPASGTEEPVGGERHSEHQEEPAERLAQLGALGSLS